MKAHDIFSYAFSAIKLRKLRASLTTLGIVIGIAAIVALLSLSQGFQDTITTQFQKGFATDALLVSPGGFGGGEFGGGGFGGGQTDFQLLINDTQTIDNIQDIKTSAPIIQKTCYINTGNRIIPVNVAGVDFVKYESIYSSTFTAEQGKIPSNPDNESIVIGARIHDPWRNETLLVNVNDTVEIIWTTVSGFKRENVTYTGHISAVLNEIGGFSLGGPSDRGVYIPISQAQSFFTTNECNSIIVQLKNSDDATIKDASAAIKSAFGGKVSVASSTAILTTINSIFSTIKILLTGIAGISLLVAGIGIMNIMLVSFMERTREVGILKALGMKSRTVLLIFLSEAAIIGLIGAVIGIASGLGLANLFTKIGFSAIGGGQGGNQMNPMGGITIKPVLTPTVFVGAFSFGLIISITFALYPAWRASKLKPVEALRYE